MCTYVIMFPMSGVQCEIQMTKSTSFLAGSLGDKVSTPCRASQNINKNLHCH